MLILKRLGTYYWHPASLIHWIQPDCSNTKADFTKMRMVVLYYPLKLIEKSVNEILRVRDISPVAKIRALAVIIESEGHDGDHLITVTEEHRTTRVSKARTTSPLPLSRIIGCVEIVSICQITMQIHKH